MISTFTQDPDALGTNTLSIALIGPEGTNRKAMASALAGSQTNATREFPAYPGLDDLPQLLSAEYDVIIIELDSNPEHALDLVENICGNSSTTVMVYSAQADSELLVRCMRAGAREFITAPIVPTAIAEALVRASVRRPAARGGKKALGKLFVFASAKGGSGVTTVASNFALMLAKESGQSTVLIDLDLPLGNVAIDLGITTQFSTANAIESSDRLDSNLLTTLLTKHRSGLSVLAAPDRYVPVPLSDQAVEKLLNVARQDFDNVVIDAGSSIGATCKTLFKGANIVYLITQVSISGLRNSNRVISEFFSSGGPQLEIVLNRFLPRSLGIDEENITKALTRPVNWKIPSDYLAARRAQNTATPLAMEDSPISQVIRQMARTACGLPGTPDKKKKFGLF
jgi:pilus assembly protein CpaE